MQMKLNSCNKLFYFPISDLLKMQISIEHRPLRVAFAGAGFLLSCFPPGALVPHSVPHIRVIGFCALRVLFRVTSTSPNLKRVKN